VRLLRTEERSFSLVEIVIALGLVSFVLVALIGLMSVGLKAMKDSHHETLVSDMALTALSKLKETDYSALPVATNYYYTYDGVVTNVTSGYYLCAINLSVPSGAMAVAPGLSDHSKRIHMELIWPLNGKIQETNVFETFITEY